MAVPGERGLPYEELPLIALNQVLGPRPGGGRPGRINAAGLSLKARTLAAQEKARMMVRLRGRRGVGWRPSWLEP